jgi:hypothetical protein
MRNKVCICDDAVCEMCLTNRAHWLTFGCISCKLFNDESQSVNYFCGANVDFYRRLIDFELCC